MAWVSNNRLCFFFFFFGGWAIPFTSVVLFLWNSTYGYFPLSLVFLSFIIFTTDCLFSRLDEFHRKCSRLVNLKLPLIENRVLSMSIFFPDGRHIHALKFHSRKWLPNRTECINYINNRCVTLSILTVQTPIYRCQNLSLNQIVCCNFHTGCWDDADR